jgi:DNA polymerase III sliding clamp (beta) subunit (PCNA family)
MSKVTFETAALADALRRAAKVAPSKGQAFDKAAGLILDIQDDVVVIKATNLETEFATWITPLEVTGGSTRWRLSSRIFAEVIGKLKTAGTLSQLILEKTGSRVNLIHGRTKASFGTMDPAHYPDWIPFAPDEMHEVEGLAEISSKVSWAASKGTNVPLTGVHFTGKLAIATDRYRVCCAPLAMTLKEPITIPAGVLSAVLPPGAPVRMRADAHKLYIMPDEYTQISTVIYGIEYPPIERVMKREYPQMLTVNKSYLLDMMGLANTMGAEERTPVLRLFLGNETVAVMMEAQGEGHLGEIMEVPGQATNPRLELKFNPTYLIGALENSPNHEVIIGYETNPDLASRGVYVNGGNGIEFWIQPLSPEAVAAANVAE